MIESSPVVFAREHEAVNFSHAPKFGEWVKGAKLRHNDFATLGLYNRGGEIRPGNFIGVVRIGESILQVDSKFQRPEMDGLAMFLRCADHPKIGERMRDCLRFWPEESPIETNHAPDFCGLVAAAFLRELNELCARRLRRNFLRETENLTGKMKGKILTVENIRRNLLRGRADRAFCAYQSVSDDILENRILRAALERTAVFLSRENLFQSEGRILERWVRACRSALRGVSVARIRPGDFAAARIRGAFSHYRKPLRLARAVLESTGFELDNAEQMSSSVVPFALNSAELFERWAQLKLLEDSNFSGVEASYRTDIGSGHIKVRPDFYIPADGENPGWILDAKYKSAPEGFADIKKRDDMRKDIYQMVAYSRHRALSEKLKTGAAGETKLALFYPRVEGEENEGLRELDADDSFYARLSLWTVSCPVKAGREDVAFAA